MSNSFIASAIAMFMVACGSCARNAVPDAPPTMQRPAVALLKVMNSDGNLDGTCTVWKAGERLAITAGHCCAPDQYYILDGSSAIEGSQTTLLIDDDENDICVIAVRMKGPAAILAANDPPIGSRVWTLGYPHGHFMISDGYWAGRNKDGQGSFSIDGAGGASGSPVLDSHGFAVAVLVQGYLGHSVTFGSPLEALRIDIARARRALLNLTEY